MDLKVKCKFRNDLYFLSNFYPVKKEYKGIAYSSAESCYQAQKVPEKVRYLFTDFS